MHAKHIFSAPCQKWFSIFDVNSFEKQLTRGKIPSLNFKITCLRSWDYVTVFEVGGSVSGQQNILNGSFCYSELTHPLAWDVADRQRHGHLGTSVPAQLLDDVVPTCLCLSQHPSGPTLSSLQEMLYASSFPLEGESHLYVYVHTYTWRDNK